MKALVKKHAEAGLWLEDVPMPQVGETDVLIRVQKAAICGTDLHIYKWDEWAQKTLKLPLTIGHEFMGIVEAVGKEVTDIKPGDRVSAEGHLVCGKCFNCRIGKKHFCPHTRGVGIHRAGAFADFVSIPKSNIFKVPSTISDDIAAVFDPLGNAVHTALSYDLTSQDVLITGAGPIGLMALRIARHSGARRVVVTDVNPYRLELALEMEASLALNPLETDISSQFESIGMTEGFNIGLEMSGHCAGLQSLVDHCICGSKIALLGLFPKDTSIDMNQIILKGLTLKGIYGREIFNTWFQMASLLESGLNIDKAITHHFEKEDFQEAFDTLLEGNCGKVILDWKS